MSTLVDDLRFRGLIHQVTDERLLGQLDDGHLSAYTGFDPTGPSLHVGHLLQLCTLRRLQLAGHRPIPLAGGVTGRIGDPGGKSDERQLLGDEELAANLAGIRPQLARFVDFDEAAGERRAQMLDNAAWLGPMTLVEFLRDVGKHFTVNQMVAKESVRARFERPDQGISYTEFSYMLLQAYDFYRLFVDHGCRLQIGGSDQWGNITMGIELVRKVCREDVFGLTTPLVVKDDGTKFGKTESGAVWLDARLTSPYQLYQFFLQTDDTVAPTYLRYFTFLSHDEITALDEATRVSPERRAAQQALARQVCTLVHGADETRRAEQAAAALFAGDLDGIDEPTLLAVVDDAPNTMLPRAEVVGGTFSLVDALVRTGLASSKSEARTLIAQGGVYLNMRRQPEDRSLGPADLLHDRYVVLRRGARHVHMLTVE